LPLRIDDIYKPNRKRLGSLFAGTSGSGKTTAVLSTLRSAIKSPSFGEFHRFVLIDPKVQSGDYDRLAPPITDLDAVMKSMAEERVTLYWPYYEEFDDKRLEQDISAIIDEMFSMVESEPKASFTFILDEASIVITPTHVPSSLKRLSVQGRAKRIMPVYISQRPLTNRWLDANLSNVILFRMLPVDADNLSKRWGVDFAEADAKIREKPYSFLRFDLEEVSLSAINPVPYPVPKIPRPKKKGFMDIMQDFF